MDILFFYFFESTPLKYFILSLIWYIYTYINQYQTPSIKLRAKFYTILLLLICEPICLYIYLPTIFYKRLFIESWKLYISRSLSIGDHSFANNFIKLFYKLITSRFQSILKFSFQIYSNKCKYQICKYILFCID